MGFDAKYRTIVVEVNLIKTVCASLRGLSGTAIPVRQITSRSEIIFHQEADKKFAERLVQDIVIKIQIDDCLFDTGPKNVFKKLICSRAYYIKLIEDF